MAALTVNYLWHAVMTLLAAETLRISSGVVRVLNIAAMATYAARQRLHRRVTRSAINQVIGVCCSSMMRSTDAPLMTTETIGQITYIGMTLGTVANLGFSGRMVRVLLRNERMTCCTITVGRYTFMALVAESLRIQLRLMVTCRNVCPVARVTIPRCGK